MTVDINAVPHVAGVVSWGYNCADAYYPGLYARVSSFETWIASTSTPSSASGPC